MSGGLLVGCGAQALDHFEVIENHRWRNAPALPVVDSLLAAFLPANPEQTSEGGVAACGLDEFLGFDLVHAKN